MKTKILFGLFIFLFTSLFTLILLEVFVRVSIIPRNFEYIQVQKDTFPQFRVVDNFHYPWLTVKNGRREAEKRGTRKHKVAFVGDSVTFCATVHDKDCFIEQIQKNQTTFDAYNFGVPGYGLLEVQALVNRLISEEKYDLIVYTFNFNDIHPASAVLLSLLKSPRNRLASVYEYGSAKDRLFLSIKDHFKVVPTARYYFSILAPKIKGLFHRNSTPSPNTLRVVSETRSLSCYEAAKTELQQGSSSGLYNRVYPAWQKMYRDEKLMKRVSQTLAEMKAKTSAQGTKLLVLPFHDLVFYVNKDKALNQEVLRAFRKAGIQHADTYPVLAKHYRECGAYSDPGHPGPLGNRIFGSVLQKEIFRRYFTPAALPKEMAHNFPQPVFTTKR